MRMWPAIEIPIDDLVLAALTEYDVAAVDEDESRAFFHSSGARDEAAGALRKQFPQLAITAIDVPDEDWAARSQANLKAVRVGNIVVAPPWDAPDSAMTIVIRPSMGFGTGHHATTRLCLAALQQLDLRDASVIDVGTGSGVLAIAAKRLGAAHVLAIDDDPDAIASARESLSLNPGAEVTLGIVDVRNATLRPFDVVIANLTGGFLVSAAESLSRLTAAHGCMVLSGLMDREEDEVRAAFAGCHVEARAREDEWVCMTLRRPLY
jgi:ribosomal protein L11 methyltransferase